MGSLSRTDRSLVLVEQENFTRVRRKRTKWTTSLIHDYLLFNSNVSFKLSLIPAKKTDGAKKKLFFLSELITWSFMADVMCLKKITTSLLTPD